MGFSDSDRQLLRNCWTAILTDRGGQLRRGAAELVDYFRALITERRARPGDDLLTALIVDCDGGDLTEHKHEAVSVVYLLLIGGHETAANLHSTPLLALCQNPDQFADLRAGARDPADGRGRVPAVRGAGLRGSDPLHRGARRRARSRDSGGRAGDALARRRRPRPA